MRSLFERPDSFLVGRLRAAYNPWLDVAHAARRAEPEESYTGVDSRIDACENPS